MCLAKLLFVSSFIAFAESRRQKSSFVPVGPHRHSPGSGHSAVAAPLSWELGIEDVPTRFPYVEMGAANSVPTGLTWPSPEAEAKLREVDGLKLYPTHAWTDDMAPIIEPEKA